MDYDFSTDITETEITPKVKICKNFIKLYHKICGRERSRSHLEQITSKDNTKWS